MPRRTVKTRAIDARGLARASWAEVEARDYAPYTDADVRIDMAVMGLEEALGEIVRTIGS
ncbi:MAG: hypothetical protein HXY28_10600 [Hydrogenophilaceae bacterium]|jgi:hypothetical protein|nr:hypothetical protein [Hydrogenophilaceae bacterium]